ncbi:MAG: LamG-like jellyroll fold domain-containing protein [Niabella sp.]
MKKLNIFVLFFIIFALAYSACNRNFDQRIDTSSIPDTTAHHSSSHKKELYVVVDGGIGKVIAEQSVRDNLYPNIYALTKTAIFSGASLTDASNVDATTYADMFTGVRKAKHGVISASSSNNLSQYHSFIDNLLAVNSTYTTSAFVQSDFMYNNLVQNAATKQILTTDEAVQSAVAANLAATTSSVVVAQYTGLKKAGDANGYGPSSTTYLAALQSFDSFLGVFLNAIKARQTIASENWVIILASNKGGAYVLGENEADGSDFSDTKRNGFLIISNPNFNLDYYPVPAIKNYTVNGTSPEELGPAANQGVLDASLAAIYNLGTSGDYTIQFKALITNRSTLIPSIMSKSSSNSGSSPTLGWSVILHGDGTRTNWSFRINGTANTGPSYELGVWNTFTSVVYDSAGKRYSRTFLNEESVAPSNITGKNGTTTSNLIIGGGPSYGANAFRGRMFDIRIYNVALPESYIVNTYCKTFVNSNEPYASNLIGYWPALGFNNREPSEKIFVDYSPNGRNVTFGSSAVWAGINLASGGNICPTYPDSEIDKIPTYIDIPRFIYTWMGIFNVQQYNLDAKLITPTYKTPGTAN